MKQIEQPRGCGAGRHILDAASICVVLWNYASHANPVVEIRSAGRSESLAYFELISGVDEMPDTEEKAFRLLLDVPGSFEKLLESRFYAGVQQGREEKLAEIREILGIE